MNDPLPAFRSLSDIERRILLQLLTPSFPGRNELLLQLKSATCRQIDDDGSLALRTECATRAPVKRRIPTEAAAPDKDGITIHFLLHVVDGKISELEIYKDDSSEVDRQPNPEDLVVFNLD